MDKELKQLKKWLDDGHTKSYLASKLGYDSSTTIDRWFDRKRIPKNRLQQLKEVIGADNQKSARKQGQKAALLS